MRAALETIQPITLMSPIDQELAGAAKAAVEAMGTVLKCAGAGTGNEQE